MNAAPRPPASEAPAGPGPVTAPTGPGPTSTPTSPGPTPAPTSPGPTPAHAVRGLTPASAGPGPTPPAAALDVVLYHYREDKAPLLREAVLPLAHRAAADGLTVHVERHWRFGPHVRLRLRGAPDRVAAAADRTTAALRTWAAAHPAPASGAATEADLLARSAAAGRAELVPPPYGPLVPDGTVRTEPVDQSSLRALIGTDGVRLRDDLLVLGLPALDAGCAFLGAHADAPAARVQLAVAALAAHAAVHPEGLVGGHYSLVSHLEDLLVHEDRDGRLRAAFERRWAATGPAVTALVGRITDGAGPRGWERAWAHWSTRARHVTDARRAAGADLTGRPLAYRDRAAALGDPEVADRWNPDVRTRYSEFHRLLSRSDPRGAMWSRPDYLVHRACTNALYRLFAICDVRPVERYLAAHLVVRTVPELTGHAWRSRVDEVIAAVEARS
ncbi:lantibiotic dehydratase C-terminal domain-containing protein [Streptomyces sp. NRRL S-87]|uniref:lantibiotic dehydratase C-terminal domain-containing protein n=1 Tax=Streptomyces sp. NRRL S-87 TaxID=1463920 RepID=UPI0004C1C317|nr:lantibiotic dehydratase C-terminal domain-containing protein [Streptomyces sp. NRRL S-87]